MLTEEDINFLKDLLQNEMQVNESTQSLDEFIFETANKFQSLFDEYYKIKNYFFEGQDVNNIDLNLIVQRYAIFKQTQSENFVNVKVKVFEIMDNLDGSFWLTFIGIIQYFVKSRSKETIELAQSVTKFSIDPEMYLGLLLILVLLSEYYNFDLTEGNNAKLLFDLFCEIKQILIESWNNPLDIEKNSKIDSMFNRIPDYIRIEWMDKPIKWFFMNDLSFKDNFFIHYRSLLAALKSGFEEGFKFLLKFCKKNMESIKTAKQNLPKTEINYHNLESFAAKVEEYGEQVKQIEHKTNLYTKLVDENSKTNMMASINDDVDNFRMKKRNLNTEINSTMRDLMKTKALLIDHLIIIRTVMALSFANMILGWFMNMNATLQKKNELIDNKFIVNLTERSCEVIEYTVEDLDAIIEQKRKVLDKIEQLKKNKTDFKGWHQIEQDCFKKLD